MTSNFAFFSQTIHNLTLSMHQNHIYIFQEAFPHSYQARYTLLDRKDCTNAHLWSKTTLITGGVGAEGVDPPS